LSRFAWLVAVGTMLGSGPAMAQLEPIGVPKGVLRFDFTGEWTSYDTRHLNGSEQDYLADFSRPALGSTFWPSLQYTDTVIAAINGAPGYAINLGKLTANGSATITNGGIGFALGVTKKLTVRLNIPIVTTRVLSRFDLDSTSGAAGYNPAYPASGIGDPGGQAAASQFFADFDQALTTLNSRIQSGFYGAGSALEAHASAVYSQAQVLRQRLGAISNDPLTASPFLPIDTSTAGAAILGRIGDLQDTLSNASGLDVQGFITVVPLPTGRLGTDEFKNFVSNAFGPVSGFPLGEQRLTRVGDIHAEASYTLLDKWDRPGRMGGIRAVAVAGVLFPTGQAENPANFLDLGTGKKRYEVNAGLTADLGYRRLGARLTGDYVRRFSSSRTLRVSPPSQPIPFLDRVARVTLDPGDVFAVSAQPFLRIAPQLAITAGVEYWRESAGSASYFSSSDVISGVSADLVAQDSERSATMIRAGLTYVGRASHECKAGKCGLPIDATLAYERVVKATGGRVPGAEAVRAMIRFYQRLW
jgi:hypothetical protein